MIRREGPYLIAVTLLTALMISASATAHAGIAGLLLGYGYWLVRIAIEAAMFIGVRGILDRAQRLRPYPAVKIALSILISLAPFALAVTALDLVLGQPELGIGAVAQPSTRLVAFGKEVIYLSDNHVALCLLLSLPTWLSSETPGDQPDEPPVEAEGYLAALSPPLSGRMIRAEAQEHYVRLTTTEETRMVLHRFSDILRDLGGQPGLQVHRSHWVARDAVAGVSREGANLRLKLRNGDSVPVSRSFRKGAEDALKDIRPT